MIAALKQAVAIYADDPVWAKVRPPLIELTRDQAKTFAAELSAIGVTMPGVGLGTASEERREMECEGLPAAAGTKFAIISGYQNVK
jgi:hypothetical protein